MMTAAVPRTIPSGPVNWCSRWRRGSRWPCRWAVGGYVSQAGSFNLVLAATPAPLQIRTLTLTPASVEVSARAATATVEVRIVHGAGFQSGWLSLVRTDGVIEDRVFVDASSRISGTAASGIYRVPLSVRQRVAPGDFLLRLEVKGRDGNQRPV